MSKQKEKVNKEELITGDFDEYLVELLKDPKEARAYLNAALEDEDYRVFLLALRDVAEAFGISNLAAESELNRENIYRMLSDKGNPKLSSVVALLRAIGIRLKTDIAEADIFEEAEKYEEYAEDTFKVKASVSTLPRLSYTESRFAKTNRLFSENEGFAAKPNQELALTA